MSELLGPLMFLVAFGLIFTGYPVAFALGGTSLAFAFVGVQTGFFDWALMYAMPERIFGIMSNYLLLAVPFFIFMGTMLEKSKLAEDLLTTIGMLFGRMRGGLALAVVFVGALLAEGLLRPDGALAAPPAAACFRLDAPPDGFALAAGIASGSCLFRTDCATGFLHYNNIMYK